MLRRDRDAHPEQLQGQPGQCRHHGDGALRLQVSRRLRHQVLKRPPAPGTPRPGELIAWRRGILYNPANGIGPPTGTAAAAKGKIDVRQPLALVLLAMLVGAPLAAAAQEDSISIAAVVNDDVISKRDLEVRERMVISSSRLQDSPETRARLDPQMLRDLIDERLKLQEAQRLDIKVPTGDVEQQ